MVITKNKNRLQAVSTIPKARGQPKPRTAVVPPLFQCDYDSDCIELFKYIDLKRWEEVCHFLDTGEWPGFSLLPDCRDPKSQAMTVVTHHHCLNKIQGSKIHWTRLPLQQAVMKKAPIAVIRRLVTLFPDGVRWANNDGQLAIHLALAFNVSDDIISLLLMSYPESVNAMTHRGITPIQAALKAENQSRGIVLSIFASNTELPMSIRTHAALLPNQIVIADKLLECYYDDNCTDLYQKIESADWEAILHFLDENEWPIGKTEALLGWLNDEKKEKTTARDQAKTWVTRYRKEDGQTLWSHLPLHLAILGRAPFDVTSRLLDVWPEAALCVDHQGMLPIHLALAYNASNNLLAKLLLLFPECLNVKTYNGLTPLDCALRVKDNSRGKTLELFATKTKPIKSIKPRSAVVKPKIKVKGTLESREDTVGQPGGMII